MSKFVKVMYGTTSGAKSDFNYKLNEINGIQKQIMVKILGDLTIVVKNVY